MAVAQAFADTRRSVRERLLDSGGSSLERHPALATLFDQVAMLCADDLRHMASAPALLSVGEIGTERTGDVLDAFSGNVVAAVFRVPEWDVRVVIALDRGFVFALVEMLFGGDGKEPAYLEERPFSGVEARVARSLLVRVGKALQSSLAPLTAATVEFERVETRMEFAFAGRRSDPVVVAVLKLEALGRGGALSVVIPQAALDPLLRNAVQESRERAAPDPDWSRHIENEVKRAEVTLRAVLTEEELTLGDIAGLELGKILPLRVNAASRVRLECNDQALFSCELGQVNGTYTLRVEEIIAQERGLVDDILSR